jgi:[ribosomal protein S5]-alanine N-acetyltransferase
LNTSSVIAETDNLVIRKLHAEDDMFILKLLNTPQWLQYIGDRGVRNADDARKYILNGPVTSYTRFGFGLYLVVLKNENAPIGICGLLKRETLQDVDLGFALLPEFVGKGYAYESASAVLQYGRTVLGLKRIVAITTPSNGNSKSLLTRLGFAFEKNVKQNNEELMLFASN